MSSSQIVYHHFLAILPDALTSGRILKTQKELREKHQLRGWPRPAHVFHVSLQAIYKDDEMTQQIRRAVSNACETVAAVTAPFEIVFEQAIRYSNSTALVLNNSQRRNAELEVFHRALGVALRRNGLPASLSTDHHLTLFYGTQELQEPVEPVQWKVDEFVLVRSHYRQTHYDFLERWKLQGKSGSTPVSLEVEPRDQATQTEFRWE